MHSLLLPLQWICRVKPAYIIFFPFFLIFHRLAFSHRILSTCNTTLSFSHVFFMLSPSCIRLTFLSHDSTFLFSECASAVLNVVSICVVLQSVGTNMKISKYYLILEFESKYLFENMYKRKIYQKQVFFNGSCHFSLKKINYTLSYFIDMCYTPKHSKREKIW